MNKQAIAFLSMFTLVFMLAIYYVSLDEETINVNAPAYGVEEVMMTIRQTIEDEMNQEIIALKTQLSDKNSNKNLILSQIEKLDQNMKRQEEFELLLNDKGYKNVIHIKDEIVLVQIFESQESIEEATKIMSYLYPFILSSELIEISFS